MTYSVLAAMLFARLPRQTAVTAATIWRHATVAFATAIFRFG